jgi:abnormal spindle-like microcephaly-associated protein
MLACEARRVPLHSNNNAGAVRTVNHDRPGSGPGKENLLPECDLGKKAAVQRDRGSVVPNDMKSTVESKKPTYSQSRLYAPTASSSARTSNRPVAVNKVKSRWNSDFLLPKPRRMIQVIEHPEIDHAVESVTEEHCKPRTTGPSRLTTPLVQANVEQRYDFLPEGVAEISMYEEDWLGHQEVALTQLVNNLFASASPSQQPSTSREVYRLRLMEVYGNADMALLYNRVKAALLYGALSLPQDLMQSGGQLYSDLGRRKTFTSFWTANYNTGSLRMALEVVIGRVVPLRISRGAKDSPKQGVNDAAQRPIQRFIEKFLIRNEDLAADSNDATTAYQRTVLRSLMLVKLLDMTKSETQLNDHCNLFRCEAHFKSSSQAVVTLMQMLNPSSGDVTRPLRNLGYAVTHIQYPLEEFNYQISNLAVDLRDGVRLTRLVELLLYKSSSCMLGYAHGNETTTVVMPHGQCLSLVDGDVDWPLSQHLKFPCASRAAKLHNVQLALSALKDIRGTSGLLDDIDAGNIVDGYREKTVRLLWGLSSKWGLVGLVDWDDVRGEIQRLGRVRGRVGWTYLAEFDLEEDEEGYLQYKTLLRAWVEAVASAHGLRIKNFTTDFADGRLFGAMVDEYQPFLNGSWSNPHNRPLAERLKTLGCSDEFVKLFAPSTMQHMFDRDFVLASTAFLCSRLLRPSRLARAAVVLQRAWRRRWDVVLVKRKEVLKGVALACADHVRAVEAKTRIWRAWCKYRARQQQYEAALSHGSHGVEDLWLSL